MWRWTTRRDPGPWDRKAARNPGTSHHHYLSQVLAWQCQIQDSRALIVAVDRAHHFVRHVVDESTKSFIRTFIRTSTSLYVCWQADQIRRQLSRQLYSRWDQLAIVLWRPRNPFRAMASLTARNRRRTGRHPRPFSHLRGTPRQQKKNIPATPTPRNSGGEPCQAEQRSSSLLPGSIGNRQCLSRTRARVVLQA
jgi:hypothetical protein